MLVSPKKGNMASLSFLLQAVTKTNHATSVSHLLANPNNKKALISVAFARTAGIDVVEASLIGLGKKAKVFVGIRNEITSKQALLQLLSYKVELYVVDTGSRHVIFHPKIYLATTANTGEAIIGSANLTFNGLHNNIEVSTHIKLDLKHGPDADFEAALCASFEHMAADHPSHVVRIKTVAEVEALFVAGRLEDEEVVRAPQPSKTKGGKDALPAMKLYRTPNSKPKVPAIPKAKPGAKVVPAVAGSPNAGMRYLVWESKPLSERDLNIPKSDKTNPTGSMGLKKGLYDDIDHRHYFYDSVFDGLQWTPDTSKPTKLRAVAEVELIISNVSYGKFSLPLSHDTDTTSRSYAQRNMMTHIHWAEAKPYVARDHLLGRSLLLYRKDSVPPEYVIEID